MIGFGQQSVHRRPVYSDMGTKLYYVESGKDGEWLTDIKGKRIGRITRYKRTRAKEISTCLSGSTEISAEEQWEY